MMSFDIYFPEISYSFPMILVKGTGNTTYRFGDSEKVNMHVDDFYISKFPITRRLWEYIMGKNQQHSNGAYKPVVDVSFYDITENNGFLDKLNSAAGSKYQLENKTLFRLPSEAEWEYAAKGGTHWTDHFQFSGSNDINSVGWYEGNAGKITDPAILLQLKMVCPVCASPGSIFPFVFSWEAEVFRIWLVAFVIVPKVSSPG